ncbi:hypothetical protein ACNKHV_12120 [Shigella flexneri]
MKSMLSNTVSSSNYKTLATDRYHDHLLMANWKLDARLTAALKKDASGVGALIVGDGKSASQPLLAAT